MGINPLLNCYGGNSTTNSIITIGRNAGFGASNIILSSYSTCISSLYVSGNTTLNNAVTCASSLI
jgi:hypothetical protein